MGDEIRTDQFSESDAKRFRRALERETELLGRWFRDQRFDDQAYQVGFELESWLIDLDCHPLPHNDAYLERYNNPLCLPDLSRFNVEFNTPHTCPFSTSSWMNLGSRRRRWRSPWTCGSA